MFKKLKDILSHNGNGPHFSKTSSFKNSPQRASRTSKNSFDFLNLIYAWDKIVGKQLAESTIPLKNVKGTLTILTHHPAYSQQLSFMEEQLKKKILEHFPQLSSHIKRFNFQTGTHVGQFEAKKEKLLKAASRRPHQKRTPL